jgi:hypothetical protein
MSAHSRLSKCVKQKSPTSRRPKTKLGLPHLDHSRSAVLDSLRSPESNEGIDTPSMNSSTSERNRQKPTGCSVQAINAATTIEK